MENKYDRISQIAYCCFYAGIVIEALLVLIDKSAYINPIEGQMFRLTFLLFMFKVCLTRYTGYEYLAIVLFGIVGGISYFATGRNEVIRLVVMIAACKDINMDKCLKMVFYLTLAGCVMLALLSVLGIYGTVSLAQDYGRGGEETRYTLGLGHPNALHCMVWALIVLCLYLYGERMKWHGYLLLFMINLFFFYLTDSKTGFLVTMVTVIYAAFFRSTRKEGLKNIYLILGFLATICSILLSVAIAANAYRIYDYVWNGDRSRLTLFFEKLNQGLNGRIRILVETDGFKGAISSWKLFSDAHSDYYFDMGWVRLFYWYGIIPGVLFIMALGILMIWCFRKKNYMAGVMLFSFGVYHITEAHGISVYLARNYLFFLLGDCWYQLSLFKGKKEWYFWRWKKDAIL